MPFLQEGGSAESDYAAAPLPAAQLIVDPDKVLLLKRGVEEERDRVRGWISRNRTRLNSVDPPGADPCSKETAKILAQNGEAALDAASGYVAQLQKMAQALDDIAKAYKLTEDHNTRRLERKPR